MVRILICRNRMVNVLICQNRLVRVLFCQNRLVRVMFCRNCLVRVLICQNRMVRVILYRGNVGHIKFTNWLNVCVMFVYSMTFLFPNNKCRDKDKNDDEQTDTHCYTNNKHSFSFWLLWLLAIWSTTFFTAIYEEIWKDIFSLW